MPKHPDQILDENLWDIEVQQWIKAGLDPDDAHAWTIMRWMYHGDLHPLVAAIREDGQLDKVVLDTLADLIDRGWVTGKRRSPFHPATEVRADVAATIYKCQIDVGKSHSEALRLTARLIGRGEESVKGALRRSRNSGKKVST
jgi:hypothetical protein